MSLHLKVFLASPGDIADERAMALEVLERLPYDPLLLDEVTVKVVAWDKPGAGAPMLATMTPQEAIAQGLTKALRVRCRGGHLLVTDGHTIA